MIGFLIFILMTVFYTYGGYFLLVLLLGRIINKSVKKGTIYPSVAILISAYNEEQDIEKKIYNTLELDYPKEKLRIIVVSDASNDNTDELVKAFRHLGVELIRVEGRVGKTEARNQAIRMISEEIILFSDATTIYEKNSLGMLIRNFADPSVGMVTGHLIYRDPEHTQVGIGQKIFWKYESLIKESQTKMGTLTGSVGCISAFRRELYTELPPHIIEDFTGPLMIIKQGYRVVFEKEAICYEETTQRSKAEWQMRVRVIRGGMAGMIYAREILNPIKYFIPSFQLISHKIFRWMVPCFMILLFLGSFITLLTEKSLLAANLFSMQLVFYFMASLSYWMEKSGVKNRLLGIILYFSVLNAAAFVAMIKTFNTKLSPTWETQRNIRKEV